MPPGASARRNGSAAAGYRNGTTIGPFASSRLGMAAKRPAWPPRGVRRRRWHIGCFAWPGPPFPWLTFTPRRSLMTYWRRIGAPAAARLAVSLALTAAAGCTPGTGSIHSPAATSAALTGAHIAARALVLTTDAGDANALAVEGALMRLGTPYDVIDVSATTLTAAMLSAGSHGNYQAVFLSRGDLVPGGGTGQSLLTAAEWQLLTDYEAAFGV